MNFYNYYYSEFSKDFTDWSKRRQVLVCRHHDIDQRLAYFVDGNTNKDLQSNFYFSWFGISVTEQILHKYFPIHHRLWIEKYGSFPIPMKGAGLGCISWDNPIWIIEEFSPIGSEDKKTFLFFLERWISFINPRLSSINIVLTDFYYSILSDKSFKTRFTNESKAFLSFIKNYLEVNYGNSLL